MIDKNNIINKNNKNDGGKNESKEFYEGETHYGEFIPSYFAWIPPEKQKEKANELGKMTNKNSKK